MDPDSTQYYIDKLLAVEGLQTDVTNLKEGFEELQTDVTNLKENVEEMKKANEKSSSQESLIEKAIFDQWKQDDIDFISTKACKGVEKNIKSRNLVIVAGHSGSGKSSIVQHIALQYREQGWTVRRIKKLVTISEKTNTITIGKQVQNEEIKLYNFY
uniref:Novel STAND NTPase 3 domain-containing protein n=1 Tax=Magallana gigas TaxID=29159 RepID=A0A8W8IKD7_MAGGI